MRKAPSAADWATPWPPTSVIVASPTGTSPNKRVTRPVTSRPCAGAGTGARPSARPRVAAVWDPPFRPHADHAAATVHALVLRGGAEDVGIDLDCEHLLGDQGQRWGLDGRQREVHAIDEVRRRAVVGERRIEDLALPPLQLDQVARAIGPQLYAGDHSEHLFELDGAGLLDFRGVEEVPLRRLAAPLEAHSRQVGLGAAFHGDWIEDGDRVTHDDLHPLRQPRPHGGLGPSRWVADRLSFDDTRARRDGSQREPPELVCLSAAICADHDYSRSRDDGSVPLPHDPGEGSSSGSHG